jgi:hypothetical protein
MAQLNLMVLFKILNPTLPTLVQTHFQGEKDCARMQRNNPKTPKHIFTLGIGIQVEF